MSTYISIYICIYEHRCFFPYFFAYTCPYLGMCICHFYILSLKATHAEYQKSWRRYQPIGFIFAYKKLQGFRTHHAMRPNLLVSHSVPPGTSCLLSSTSLGPSPLLLERHLLPSVCFPFAETTECLMTPFWTGLFKLCIWAK